MKSICQTKTKGKLMQIGTKLGKNTTFLHIIYYMATTTLKWHKFLGIQVGVWNHEIVNSYESCDFGAS